MATMNVSLPDPMKAWIEDQAIDGRFSNSSDYVRHLIRQEQERQEAVAKIQDAVDAGLASGDPVSIDPIAFKTAARQRRLKDR